MSFFLKKQFNVDANINNTVFLTSLLFEFIEKTDIFFLKQVYFFTNTICTIKKQIQTPNLLSKEANIIVQNTALSVGAVFCKLIIATSFTETSNMHTANTYDYSNMLIKRFNKNQFLIYKPLETIHMLKNIYLLFFNVGFSSGYFSIIGSDEIAIDCQAVNYAILNRFGKFNFFKNLYTETAFKNNTFDLLFKNFNKNLDFIIILNTNIKLTKYLGRTMIKPFLIGLANSVET